MKFYLSSILFLFSIHSSTEYKFETVLDNLDDAWSFVFLSEDKILFTEMPGKLRIASLTDKSIINVTNIPEVAYSSQGGLSEVVLDPDFSTNNKIYISYSAKKENKKITLYLASAELKDNKLVNRKIIFEANAYRRSPAHMGAKIAFLNDGTLLLTSGDGYDHREKAQSLDNHFGKIIRINRDGSIPKDNPFISNKNALSDIYSYGHRNMQGLIITSSGEIYEHEHGPKGGDEINIIIAGDNYGWPVVSHGFEYGTNDKVSEYDSLLGFNDPEWVWLPSIAPSGMDFYPLGSDEKMMFPNLQGTLLVGSLKFRRLYTISINEDGLPESESILIDGTLGRIRDVAVAKDGSILILNDESSLSKPVGALYRIFK